MAVLKLLNKKGKYHDPKAFKDVIGYIIDIEKVKGNYIATGGIISPETAAKEMLQVFRTYQKKSIRLYHMVLNFSAGETVEAETAYKVAKGIAVYFADRHQFVAGVHEDTDLPHIHFVWNAVSFIDGKKFRLDKNAKRDLQRYIERQLDKMGYEIDISMVFG